MKLDTTGLSVEGKEAEGDLCKEERLENGKNRCQKGYKGLSGRMKGNVRAPMWVEGLAVCCGGSI